MKINKLICATLGSLALISADAVAQQNITLESIWYYGTYRAKSPRELQSTADGMSYTMMESARIINQYSYATGAKERVLVNLDEVRGGSPIESIEGYEVASNGEYVLIYTNSADIYRHSFIADYYIYDIAHKSLLKLTEKGGEQEAAFAPNGYMVSFVQGNNLKIYKIKYQSVSNVTTDGERNKIINGIPDWVYEEEFSTSRSYEWSTDSKKIAYIRYDETEVPEYSFPMYKGSYPTYEENALYPGYYTYKYPKAGEKNSTVSVHVFNLDSRTTKQIDLGKGDFYVPRITWTGAQDQLSILKLNRLQNEMNIIHVNTNSLISTNVYTDKNKKYVDEPAYQKLTYFNDGKNFVVANEQDGYNHLYLYDNFGTMVKKLTEGPWDVTDVYGFNAKLNTFYYQAAQENPMNREVYAINLKTYKTDRIGSANGTAEATFSTGCNFYTERFSTTRDVPTFSVCDNKGKKIRVIEDNAALKAKIANTTFQPKEFFSFKTSEGVTLNGWQVKPRDMKADKKYPVLVVQYSGPNSQRVKNEWGIDWEQTLASEGYIVICVDPRGTGGRGEEFRKCTYLNLGKLESDDMIELARYLGKQTYVDKDRIGIWGWSYGGFMSTLCLCKSDLFKVGIAVAPVINWRYYDSIYTERFMQLPQYNANGYDQNSPLTWAKNLKGKYLIIHGTADDNVHYQNQMEMVDALVAANKQFEMFTYPNWLRTNSLKCSPIRTEITASMAVPSD